MWDNVKLIRAIGLFLNFIKWKIFGVRMPWSFRNMRRIHHHVRIRNPSKVTLGYTVTLHPYSYLKSVDGSLSTGDYSSIGELTYINSARFVSIGSHVFIAPSCHITDANHGVKNPAHRAGFSGAF